MNLDTTPNNDFRYPTSANNGAGFATGIQDLANDIDGMWLSGTLVDRPAASKINRIYYATDVDQWFGDTGAAWELLDRGPAGWALTQPTRALLTSYQPNASRPTFVSGWGSTTSNKLELLIGATSSPTITAGSFAGGTGPIALIAIVPPGWYYQFQASGGSLEGSLTVIEFAL